MCILSLAIQRDPVLARRLVGPSCGPGKPCPAGYWCSPASICVSDPPVFPQPPPVEPPPVEPPPVEPPPVEPPPVEPPPVEPPPVEPPPVEPPPVEPPQVEPPIR